VSEPTLSLTFSDIYAEVGEFMGYGRAATGKTAEVKRHGNAGYRRFLAGMDPRMNSAYDWSFLSPHDTIELWGDTTGDTPAGLTGTTDGAGNSATTVGMSAATFFDSMVGHRLAFAGGSYEIISYASGKTVTVLGDATTVGSSSGCSVTANGVYGLPDDFAYMMDDPAYETDETPGTLANRSVSWIRHQRSGEGTVTGPPNAYAVAPRAFTTRTGQRHDLLVWPVPASNRTMRYRYRVNPDALSGDDDYPYGGAMHADTIFKCAKAAAEEHMEDKRPFWQDKAKEAMAASIDMDARNKPSNLGAMTDNSDDLSPMYDRRGDVSYD